HGPAGRVVAGPLTEPPGPTEGLLRSAPGLTRFAETCGRRGGSVRRPATTGWSPGCAWVREAASGLLLGEVLQQRFIARVTADRVQVGAGPQPHGVLPAVLHRLAQRHMGAI